MKTFNGRTIVRPEKRVNDKIMIGGKEFILDSAFRHYWNTVHMAEVVVSDRDDLEPGDIVYVHHFINAPEQILPFREDSSYMESNQIYCRIRNGEMKVLDDYVLVSPVTYGDTGIITKNEHGILLTSRSPNERIEKVGVAELIGDNAKKKGINIGDKILFNKNCEYEILIEGKLYYRMEIRDIITTIDDWTQIKVK